MFSGEGLVRRRGVLPEVLDQKLHTLDDRNVRDLPSGTVTFLFTDVEGSTQLLHELGAERYAEALTDHRRVLREAFAAQGGVEVDTQGDAFFVAFPTAPGALAAAAAATEQLAAGPIRVRMGVHTGTPHVTDEGYVGVDVHRAARIAAIGHGGQVLVSAATRALVDGLTDLGDHRLKDLSAPERLYQLGETKFPPLKSLYRTNLPVPGTPFVGRERELADVLELLGREDLRLLTLTGPGGTGKTRLALQAAGSAADDYQDGVFWVPLAPLREPELVLETTARTLGADQDLAAHIADKSFLVLMDNFEHVVEAAAGVAELLAACPTLRVIVTSREPLHVSGEQEYGVPPFAHEEAVRFFIGRARAVDDGFQANGSVAEICHRLDELPLALELAAVRVKAFSPVQILALLERRLPLLTGGARDLPERQRTLRATIEWSYELLTSAEQSLFARMAVFVGGCTLDAAQEVAEADIDTLLSLVDKSLLRHADDRYLMLETIREFAHEQLMRLGEAEALAARHADCFIAVAERAKSSFGTSGEAASIELLVRDQDNFRAALAYVADSPLQLRLACALWRFWLHRGHHSEGRRWLEAALLARDDAPPADVALGLRAAAVFARVHGDLDVAERLSIESVAIASGAGERKIEMDALGTLANVALVRSDYPRAAELMAEVETLGREIGDENAVAVTGANRAYLAIQMADFDLALTLAEESVALSRKAGDSTNAASAALNVALAAHACGKQRVARDALVEGIELARSLRHSPFLVDALIIAAALIVASDPSTASVLLAVADRGQTDLTIELEPVERELRASVERQLPDRADDEPIDPAARDLDTALDVAASRALQSLAKLVLKG
jgi:predicted ATPase/class 3 adenylate cyclase